MPNQQYPITHWLALAQAGDAEAAQQLFPLLYTWLHRRAAAKLREEGGAPSWTPTDLVNEAWLRLAGGAPTDWQHRGHFFCAAAEAMRRALIDHARARLADKRGGGMLHLSLDPDLASRVPGPEQLVALDGLIERLARRDAETAQIVVLKVFAGLEMSEIAQSLGLSERSVFRKWSAARAWLAAELR
jgi:RNA polymerase sigma factor (TIGR02999 family)